MGVRYFMQFLAAGDANLAKAVKLFKANVKYKSKVVPEKKQKKALKMFKKFIKGSEYVPKALQNELGLQFTNALLKCGS